jgi:predicted RNase H-like HicB family nuclease
MTHRLLEVRACWDDTASVWVATSDDVPGLVTEADTFEALRDKVLSLVPELMADNGLAFDADVQLVHIIAEQTSRAAAPALAP